MKVKELYSDKSKWTQRYLALLANGMLTDPTDPDAVSFCLVGAIKHCYPKDITLRKEILGKIQHKIGCPAMVWNDHPERTFAEVKALAEELDI